LISIYLSNNNHTNLPHSLLTPPPAVPPSILSSSTASPSIMSPSLSTMVQSSLSPATLSRATYSDRDEDSDLDEEEPPAKKSYSMRSADPCTDRNHSSMVKELQRKEPDKSSVFTYMDLLTQKRREGVGKCCNILERVNYINSEWPATRRAIMANNMSN